MKFLSLFILLAGTVAAQKTASFPTPDGGEIYGDIYGSGARAAVPGVVLAHGGGLRKESWKAQADVLASAGFLVLAIDFRGEGKSHGGNTHANPGDDGRRFDVLGAVHYLRSSGVKSVSVVGASMGGDYAAEAAELEPSAIDRIVLFASGAYTALVRMKGPKLYILARDDANTEGPRLPHIRVQYERSSDPKQLVLVNGSAHAQHLFTTPEGPQVLSEIMRFLTDP